MNKDVLIADMKKRQGNAKGDEADALHYAIQKVEHDFDDDGSMKINHTKAMHLVPSSTKSKSGWYEKR